jgi:hypothetical protein
VKEEVRRKQSERERNGRNRRKNGKIMKRMQLQYWYCCSGPETK